MVVTKKKSASWEMLVKMLSVCLAAMLLVTACSAKKKDRDPDSRKNLPAKVTSVKVETGAETDRVVIATDPGSIPYSVYKWVDPIRVVVDIADAVLDQLPSIIPVADDIIQEVEVKVIQTENEEDSSLVRVIINLKKISEYEVSEDNDGRLVVTLDKSESSSGNIDLFPDTETVSSDTGDSPSELKSGSEDWAWSGQNSQTRSQASKGRLGKNLLDIETKNEKELTRVSLVMDGAVGDYSAFTLENPARLVVDIWGVKNKGKLENKIINQQGILRVRAGQHPDKIRLVFDANGNLPHFRFDKGAQRLMVTFSKSMDVSATPGLSAASATETSGASKADATASNNKGADWPVMNVAQAEGREVEWAAPSGPDESTGPAPVGTRVDWGSIAVTTPDESTTGKVGIAYINSIKFDYSNDASSIIIHADRPLRREQWTREDNPEEKIVSIFISDAQVAADQQRSYDTTEFQSPVELFSVFQKPDPTRPNEVAIVIVMRDWAASKWDQYDKKLKFQFENYPGSLGLSGAPTAGMFGPRGEEITGGMAPGLAGPVAAPSDVMSLTGAPQYTGQVISLDFKDMQIMDALRTIAEVSGMNMVVSENVKGKITIKLDSVPWDQILDLILDTKGLGKVQTGNIIRIATKRELEKEKAEKLASLEAEEKYEPLITKIIPVNYLKAADLVKIVSPSLTKGRGKVIADKRTNSIIIRDIPKAVEESSRLISKLDRPTKQVLIEARIVEASVGVTRELGVRWGTNVNIGPDTGTPTGVNFPNAVQVGGAVLGGMSQANLNAPFFSDGGGSIGMSIGSLTDIVDLDVMLRALEAREKVKIISSPRILTLSDEKAVIQQGVSIPYAPAAVIGTGGQGWLFVEATLRLEVTPHVADDNSIILELKISNNEPVVVAGSQAPGVSKKEAQTTILIHDGETAVIGGIFKITKKEPKEQIPFLGNIPVIGRFFQHSITESRNEELIIFLTPQVIQPTNRNEVLAGGAATRGSGI